MILCGELNREWKKHQSNYFDRWKKMAFSRKQVKRVALTTLETIIVALHDAPIPWIEAGAPDDPSRHLARFGAARGKNPSRR